MKNRMFARILAATLTVLLLFTAAPAGTFAEEEAADVTVQTGNWEPPAEDGDTGAEQTAAGDETAAEPEMPEAEPDTPEEEPGDADDASEQAPAAGDDAELSEGAGEDDIGEPEMPEEQLPDEEELPADPEPVSVTGDDYSWSIDSDGVLTVTGRMKDYSRGDNGVTTAPWGDRAADITAVIIADAQEPGTVEGTDWIIGSYAFCGCSELKSVTIPDGVVRIGDGAFYGCTALRSITVPDSVKALGDECIPS